RRGRVDVRQHHVVAVAPEIVDLKTHRVVVAAGDRDDPRLRQPGERPADGTSQVVVDDLERVAHRRQEADGKTERTVQADRAVDVELVVLRGRGAVELNGERARGRLRKVPVDLDGAGRVAGAEDPLVDDVAVDGPVADERAGLDVDAGGGGQRAALQRGA